MRREGSRYPQFIQRIPNDVRSRLAGRTLEVPLGDGFVSVRIGASTQAVRFSLRSDDPSEVKRRQAQAAAHLESVFADLRANTPNALTHRQCVALAGEVYRAWAGELETFTTTAIQFDFDGSVESVSHEPDHELDALAAQRAIERLQQLSDEERVAQFAPLIDRILARHAIVNVDARSRDMLAREVDKALSEGLRAFSRKSSGDYAPDPIAQRFPEFVPTQPPAPQVVAANGSYTFDDLFTEWEREAKATGRKPSTLDSYARTMRVFRTFVNHDDPRRVTPEDVVRFKTHRLDAGVSPKTVKDSDLAALKTLFGWGRANLKLPINPVEGITLKMGSRPRLRSKGFSDGEAKAILTLAATYKQGLRESRQMAAAKRWVPWLCAFTGARLGEIVQLRKQDVRQEEGHWVIHITPEAGTVKTDEARDVPLHPQLVEMGFPAFVQGSCDGYLFMVPTAQTTEAFRGAWRTAKNRVTEFVRPALKGAAVAPSHGWRHRFKTLMIEQGVSERVIDALLGHKPTRVADTYGEVTLAARVRAIGVVLKVNVAST